MVAYNERIVRTSGSAQRVERAQRMLTNLQPLLEQLRRTSAPAVVGAQKPTEAPVVTTPTDDLEPVWNGAMGRAGKALTDAEGLGSSLGPGNGFALRT